MEKYDAATDATDVTIQYGAEKMRFARRITKVRTQTYTHSV